MAKTKEEKEAYKQKQKEISDAAGIHNPDRVVIKSMAVHKDTIYVATDLGLYTLEDGGVLTPVTISYQGAN